MKIKSEFVPYGFAVRLKNIGYEDPCFAMWTTGLSEFETSNVSPPRLFSSKFNLNDTQSSITYVNHDNMSFGVAAPTWQSAFKWFRINYDLIGFVERIFSDEFGYTITEGDKEPINGFSFDSFESAELHCLDKLINIVETSKKTSSL
jgi:hypothetical protein